MRFDRILAYRGYQMPIGLIGLYCPKWPTPEIWRTACRATLRQTVYYDLEMQVAVQSLS